jgi:hypothetical protein
MAISVTELMALISDGFVTFGNAFCSKHFFNVSQAKCKSMIKLHSVTDYLGWIAISGINIGISHPDYRMVFS